MEPTDRATDESPSQGNGQLIHDPADDLAPLESTAAAYTCPECGVAFSPESIPADNVLVCPSCGVQFFTPSLEEPDQADAEDRLREEEQARRRADELDQAHYKQVLAFRRGLNRMRSLYLIFFWALLIVAGQLVVLILKRSWDYKAYAFLFAAIACVLGALAFPKKIKAVDLELEQTRQRDPEREPDFSTLSDGSERWKAIESLGQQTQQEEPPEEGRSDS